MIRRLWGRLRVPAVLGLLVAVVYEVGSAQFLKVLGHIDVLVVVVTFAVGVPSTVCAAWRWCLVARRLGLGLSLGAAVADYYRSMFLNAVLPGGVFGDVYRGVRHGKESGALGRGVRAVVLERCAGQVVLVTVAVPALAAGPSVSAVVGAAGVPLVVAAAVLGVSAGAVALGLWRGWGAARWRRALAVVLAEVRVGLFGRDVLPGVLVLSALTLTGHLGLFVLAARVAGITAPVATLVPLLLCALMAMALPVGVGGWGPREGACVLVFGAAGLGAQQGLAASVVYGVLVLVSSLPGAGVLVVRFLVGRRTGSQIQCEEGVLAECEGADRGA